MRPDDQATDAPRETAELREEYARPEGWVGRVMASSPEQARRWMRWAWVGGLVWCVWQTWVTLMGIFAIVLFSGPLIENPSDTTAANLPDARILIYAAFEAIIVAGLSLGVRLRSRPAAALLAGGFFASRVALIALGLFTPAGPRGLLWLLIFGALLFLFVRGVQGAFSYHWFTHPRYPAARG